MSIIGCDLDTPSFAKTQYWRAGCTAAARRPQFRPVQPTSTNIGRTLRGRGNHPRLRRLARARTYDPIDGKLTVEACIKRR